MVVRSKVLFRNALADSVPVMMGYLSMGAAFGVLLTARIPQANAWWVALMSGTTISGSMQYAAVELLADSTAISLGMVAMLSVLVNIRYPMYGFTFLNVFPHYPWYIRYFLIWTLTDEIFALESSTRWRGTARMIYCLYTSLLGYSYWLFGSVLGALAGNLITFDTTGIDFAMTALFLAILVDLVRERANRLPALIGGAATLFSWIFFVTFLPGQLNKFLLAAMALMISVMLLLRKKLERKTGGAR